MLSSTAASGANASVSSSWKEDASQTTVAVGLELADERADAPCRRCRRPRPAGPPRGGCGRSARSSSSCRWCRHRDELVGQQPPGQLELAEHRQSRARAPRRSPGAARGTPGLLTTAPTRSSSAIAILIIQMHFDAPRAASRRGSRRRAGIDVQTHLLPARAQRQRRRQRPSGPDRRPGTGRPGAAAAAPSPI